MLNKPYSKFILFVLALSALLVLPVLQHKAQAEKTPDLPPPLTELANNGAQIRYLGNQYGLDGWIAIQGGQEQYFYVTQDGRAFVMGLLFNRDGKIETLKQVQKLQAESGGETLNMITAPEIAQKQKQEEIEKLQKTEFLTPAEQLFASVENTNWIPLGKDGAPVIYSFVDPQCPHCHAFMNDLRQDYIQNGLIQVRIIPVGMDAERIAQAAFLLAVPNPQNRWYRHLDGDKDAIPVTPGINDQGVQRNLSVMQAWDLNVTPLTIYRNKNGDIKIIQGRAKNVSKLMKDLPATAHE